MAEPADKSLYVSPEDRQGIRKMARRFYLRALLIIMAGAGLLLLAWKNPGLWYTTAAGIIGIITMVGGLMLLATWVKIFRGIERRLDAEEQLEPFKETYITWPPWFKKWLYWPLVIILPNVFLLFASKHENDFGGNRFVWHSAIMAMAAGFLIYQGWRLLYPYSNNNKRAEIVVYLTVLIGFTFFALGPLVNRINTGSPLRCHRFKIESVSNNYLHIFNSISGKKERFQPPSAIRRQAAGRDSITLCIQKGSLGYDYVKEFQLP